MPLATTTPHDGQTRCFVTESAMRSEADEFLQLPELAARQLPDRARAHALQLARAKAHAAADPRDPAAADRLEFLKRHLEEMVFDIPCPNGHSLLRTMPQLARAIRHSPGEWVDLDR